MTKMILSINQNRSMNYLLHTVLSKNYSPINVSNVYQGIAELRKNAEIDLIIIDIDYQTTENLEFIQHIKTSSLYQTPVMVLLSDQNEEVMDKLMEADVQDYFPKPFSPLELLKSVDELMLPAS